MTPKEFQIKYLKRYRKIIERKLEKNLTDQERRVMKARLDFIDQILKPHEH